MPTEELNLIASVEDEFSAVLTELELQLYRIGSLEEAVFDIEVGVDGVSETLAELQAVAATMDTIDSGVDVDVDTDSDVSGTVSSAASTASSTASSAGEAMTSGGQPIRLPIYHDPGIRVRERDSLTDQFLDLQFVMGDFFKILAALIPMMGTFIGALPAAIAGLGALAGAALAAAGGLAAIGGLGLLGMAMTGDGLSVRRLQQRITRLGNTFVQAFRPIAESFVPVVEEAFRDLNFLVRDLGRNAGVLRSLTDDFTALTHFLSRNTAPVLADVVAFGEMAVPLFTMLGERFPDVNMIALLGSVLADTLPLLAAIVTDLGRFLPIIYELSLGFLAATRGIMMMFGGLGQILNVLPYGLEVMGALAGVLLTLLSVSAMYTVVNNSLQGGLLSLFGAVQMNAAAFQRMTAAELMATLQSYALSAALMTLYSVLTLGIAAGIGWLTSQFVSLEGGIRSATDALREFNGVSANTGGFGSMSGFSGGGGVAGGNVVYKNYNINANSREDATRITETLSYMEGTRRDSEFASGI
ncbi:hypothetical protein ACFQJD_18625 [Haloplanus sp. GCM10025708]|uniref:hypothetical protein n=1 Tax=Haloferacaceae TaxID=1644056 RepID=UPI00361FCD28